MAEGNSLYILSTFVYVCFLPEQRCEKELRQADCVQTKASVVGGGGGRPVCGYRLCRAWPAGVLCPGIQLWAARWRPSLVLTHTRGQASLLALHPLGPALLRPVRPYHPKDQTCRQDHVWQEGLVRSSTPGQSNIQSRGHCTTCALGHVIQILCDPEFSLQKLDQEE